MQPDEYQVLTTPTLHRKSHVITIANIMIDLFRGLLKVGKH